jgi:signal transduction histidine kinase
MGLGFATYLLGYLSGVLSTLSPYVLPLLPIVLGSAVAASRFGPLALTAGVMLSFSAVGIFFATVGATLGLNEDAFRDVAEDDQQTFVNLNKLLLVLFFSLPGILLVSLIGGYILAGRVLSPMDEITRRASQITADNLSQRLPVDGREDEFSRLASVFNETFERLEDAFKRMKRFTADASHELRTPLAVIRNAKFERGHAKN